MAPIRVALIGLSSTAKTSWAEEGHLPYLLSPMGKAHYEIVALLNSSTHAAEAAKAHFELPPDVKTYGAPEALAVDANIDLVVCNTRVDTHVALVKPSLEAGKAIYVEWPLAHNLEQGSRLLNGSLDTQNIVGFQGRVSPISLKLKEIIESGRIGRILSSDVRAFGCLFQRDGLSEGLAYFAERKIGGNPITIAFAHMVDYVQDVLGDFASFSSHMQVQWPNIRVKKQDGDFASFSSRMQVQSPNIRVKEQDGTTGTTQSDTTRTIKSDVPDLLSIHGHLKQGRRSLASDATLSITFRNGPPFKGMPAFLWSIVGEKGEIMVTSPAGPYLMSHSYSVKPIIELHDHETDEVVQVEWDWKDWQKKLPALARNVGELYERYAAWVERGRPEGRLREEEDWPRVAEAVGRLRELDEIFRQFDKQRS